ncbi:uncharacterized protein LOC121263186 [Juglans microcarpa x Juglans regia]|uniref:uncharacterized protein LOC121263186 n=1 Tax=Juglans microcarpa x Juglans regia TaxID=2249226 RepID=UPI001B7EBEB7|nr:uncharacterized protein LOC121263186 [Juglans microcarpa x Juglans regia]
MKVSGLCVLFLALGTDFLLLNFSSGISTGSFIIPEMVFAQHAGGDAMPLTTASRRLKENGHNSRSEKKHRQIGDVNLDDYHPMIQYQIQRLPSNLDLSNTGLLSCHLFQDLRGLLPLLKLEDLHSLLTI